MWSYYYIYNHILRFFPAFVYGARILSVDEMKNLCRYQPFENLRAETTFILSKKPQNLQYLLTHHINQLSTTLRQMVEHSNIIER